MITQGTIIDIETTGEFDEKYDPPDLRRFGDIKPTLFGYLVDDVIVQHCAESIDDIQDLVDYMTYTIPLLQQPFFALYTPFERHLLSKYCGLDPVITDVRGKIYMGKWKLREVLEIPTYNDPFDGDGNKCRLAWDKGDFESCLIHNQACLQIERDILEVIRYEPDRLPDFLR